MAGPTSLTPLGEIFTAYLAEGCSPYTDRPWRASTRAQIEDNLGRALRGHEQTLALDVDRALCDRMRSQAGTPNMVRINTAALRAFLVHEAVSEHGRSYVAMHRALQQKLGVEAPDPGGFLAEELLRGRQTTVEGWLADGQAHLLGIVDSVMHPGTRAFARFETPSALPAAVQAKMADLARRVALGSGLVRGPFNVELIWHRAFDGAAMYDPKGAVVAGMSGIDMACWDIMGKALGQPVCKLIGGLCRDAIEAYA